MIFDISKTYEKLINQITAEVTSPSVPPNTEMPSGSNSIPTDVNQNPTNVLSSKNASERPVYPIYDDSAAIQIDVWKLVPDLTEKDFDEATKYFRQWYNTGNQWILDTLPSGGNVENYRFPSIRGMDALIAVYQAEAIKKHNALSDEWNKNGMGIMELRI